MPGNRRCIVVVCAALLNGCAAHHGETLLRGETMGSAWTIKLPGPLPAPAAELRAGAQQRFDAVVAQLSTYEPDSSLSRFNRDVSAGWQTLPPDLFTVLATALELAAATDGAYDVTVGPLVNLWGFGPGVDTPGVGTPRVAAPDARVPAGADIAAARKRVGWQKVELDAATLRARKPAGVYIDLSSLGKGFGVEQVAQYLETRGIHNYLIDLSGKLRGGGVNAQGRPWRVAVERAGADDPAGDARITPAVVTLHDAAVASAGNYRRHFVAAGRDYSHIIDPRSGYPIAHEVQAVTVLADDCMQADALATALLVMQPQAAMQLAESRQIAALFIVGLGAQQRLQPTRAWLKHNGG